MLSVKILSYGPLNSATHIFTRLERLLTISDRGRIAGVCCPNQIKNHHFVICRTLTSYLSLNFIITNNHTELQSPRGRRFCLLSWSTFYGTIQGYTKRGRIQWCAALEDKRIWTFQTFSLFVESLVKTKKKCHFLLTPVVPKRQNKPLLN